MAVGPMVAAAVVDPVAVVAAGNPVVVVGSPVAAGNLDIAAVSFCWMNGSKNR